MDCDATRQHFAERHRVHRLLMALGESKATYSVRG